jgi:hypothetical protein
MTMRNIRKKPGGGTQSSFTRRRFDKQPAKPELPESVVNSSSAESLLAAPVIDHCNTSEFDQPDTHDSDEYNAQSSVAAYEQTSSYWSQAWSAAVQQKWQTQESTVREKQVKSQRKMKHSVTVGDIICCLI